MDIIKCHMCKLDINSCNYKCIELDDVSVLYKDGQTERDAIPDGFCTFHDCPHNLNGFKCELDKCVLLKDIKE